MSWTALVPIKSPGDRKSRLAALLSQDERVRLSDFMFWHVLGVLQQVPSISQIAVISAELPPGWKGRWIVDTGRGLNAELQSASAAFGRNILVIHADLPALTVDDVDALLAAAERETKDAKGQGVAIAPDRHQSGTNAVAVEDASDFRFSFGARSFAKHCTIAAERGTTVCRDGLALDVDFPDDLNLALERGVLARWRAAGVDQSRATWPESEWSLDRGHFAVAALGSN